MAHKLDGQLNALSSFLNDLAWELAIPPCWDGVLGFSEHIYQEMAEKNALKYQRT